MTPRTFSAWHLVVLSLPGVVTLGSLVWASDAMPTRLYDVTIETGMPHLEENLRYSTTHATRCLAHQDLPRAFPVLEQPALKGCRLNQAQREGDVISYLLVCDGGHGTTGEAVWRLGEDRITGTLQIKLGGKNMTFHQRVTAIPVGECAGRK